jgi:MFS family permease
MAALREPGLRRFSSATLAWGSAHQMVTVSQGYILFDMTDSKLWLAALGASVGFPNVLAAVLGGVLSDRFERKYLLMAGSFIVALPMLSIAILFALDLLQPWHILVAGAAQGVSLALDWTSRLSLLPNMVPRRVVVSSLSIDQSVFNGARVLGPLAAGLVLRVSGASTSYSIIAGLFAVAIVLYISFKPVRSLTKTAHSAVLSELSEAARLLGSEPVLGLNVLFTAANAMMLGGFVYMVPAFAKEVFDTGATGVGLLFAATGTGAFLGALLVAIRGGTDSAGRGLFISNILFAAAAVLYAFTGSVWLATPVAFMVGLFNAIHVAIGISAIQVNVPDEIRGRVTGAYELAWASFPLGGLVVGSLAEVTSLRWAVIAVAAAVTLMTVAVFSLSARMRHLRLNP